MEAARGAGWVNEQQQRKPQGLQGGFCACMRRAAPVRLWADVQLEEGWWPGEGRGPQEGRAGSGPLWG